MKFIACFCTTCRQQGREEDCLYKGELGEWVDVGMRFTDHRGGVQTRKVDGAACFFCRSTNFTEPGGLSESDESGSDEEDSSNQRAKRIGLVMLLCDGCDRGFHMKCMRNRTYTSTPKSQQWLCDFCVTKRGGCRKCKQNDVYEKKSLRLLHCGTCDASWHMQCLETPLTIEPQGEWHCDACESEIEPVRTSSVVVTRSQLRTRICGKCNNFIPHDEARDSCVECQCCEKLWHIACVSDTKLKLPANSKNNVGKPVWICPTCPGS
jgi:hypothetical protein